MTEHITVNANGLSFHVVTEGAGDRLALCLHGFPASSASFRPQIPLLTRLGYRVWIPDLRGYGRSDKPRNIAAYTVDELQKDVAGLIDASGAKHVTLVGHDWGAVIAWAFASSGQRPLERLVIFNVPHPVIFERALRSPRQLLRSWYMLALQVPLVPELILGSFGALGIERSVLSVSGDKARFPAALLDEWRHNATDRDTLTAMINYYRAIPLGLFSRNARKHAMIQTPTLVIYSENDPVIGKELFADTSRYVADLTQREIAGTSHWLPDEAADQVNPILEGFLAREKSRPSVRA